MGGNTSPERRSGCGMLTVVFGGGRSSLWPKKHSSSSSSSSPNRMPAREPPQVGIPKSSSHHKQGDRIIHRPDQNYSRPSPVYHHHHQKQQQQQLVNQTMSKQAGLRDQQGSRRQPEAMPTLSGELNSMIAEHQRSNGAGLVRASSGNVMLYGNLGNLHQPGNFYNAGSGKEPLPINRKYNPGVKPDAEKKKVDQRKTGFCRDLSTRMDPEQLKILGNEDYKNGQFAEAVAFYDAAISIEPNKASYRSNKSAALTAMGKLLEAAFECREAIRIDPFYQRAHNKLATLYVRLGEAERAMYYFKQAGPEADPDAMSRAKQVQAHLNKCTEAKKWKDWNSLVKEADLSIAAGADSAPPIFTLKADALLKLNRLQEAVETMASCPNFDTEECTKFFGPIGSANLLVIHAQIDLIEGRFDDAVAAAQRACRQDENNKEASTVLRKARAVATARLNGNELYMDGRYEEACQVYGRGLSHDPCNAVLLGNRAACQCKLRRYDMAVEDCSTALIARPGYSKARLRRADCYAKMGKWDACVKDCQVLVKENPDDQEVARLLAEAKARIKMTDLHGVQN